jgi:hypothetical protein
LYSAERTILTLWGNRSDSPLVTDCQPFTPLGTPPFQHKFSTLGGHAFLETVRLLSFAVIRLKRSFHDFFLSTNCICMNVKTTMIGIAGRKSKLNALNRSIMAILTLCHPI